MRASLSFLTPLLLLLLPLSCSIESEHISDSRCGQACYTGPVGTVNVGICAPGKSLCDSEGTYLRCEGDVLPYLEESVGYCDGVDQDCNGLIDDKLNCFIRVPNCFPFEEVCDGVDNDCDGYIDNIKQEPCFSGTQAQLQAYRSGCHVGITSCLPGRIGSYCQGEGLPSKEICDKIDNDCDGYIDNKEGSISKMLDIVIAIDRSGSMASDLGWIRIALIHFLTKEAAKIEPTIFEGTQIGIMYVPGPDSDLQIAADLGTAANALNLISKPFSLEPTGRGDEPSLDCFYGLAQGQIHLSWRLPAEKLIIWIGDEFAMSKIGVTTRDAWEALAQEHMHPLIVTDPIYNGSYNDIATEAKGGLYPLTPEGLGKALSFAQKVLKIENVCD